MNPFDYLDDLEEETVRIVRHNKEALKGTLEAFDRHQNVVLSDAEGVVSGDEFERTFIRGNTVAEIFKEGEYTDAE